jgi:hypothetical protein
LHFLWHCSIPCSQASDYNNCCEQYPKECVCFSLHWLQAPQTFLSLLWNAEHSFTVTQSCPYCTAGGGELKRASENIKIFDLVNRLALSSFALPTAPQAPRTLRTNSHFNIFAWAAPHTPLAVDRLRRTTGKCPGRVAALEIWSSQGGLLSCGIWCCVVL